MLRPKMVYTKIPMLPFKKKTAIIFVTKIPMLPL